MNARRAFILGTIATGAMVGLSALRGLAEDRIQQECDVDQGRKNPVGVGYGHIRTQGSVILDIWLLSGEGSIHDAGPVDVQDKPWGPNDDINKNVADKDPWFFESAPVTMHDSFAAIFHGTITPEGQGEGQGQGQGGGGQRPEFDVAVCDVDLDADTNNNPNTLHRTPGRSAEEDLAEQYPLGENENCPGLILGVNDDHDQYWYPYDAAKWDRDSERKVDGKYAIVLDKEGSNFKTESGAHITDSVDIGTLKLDVHAKKAGMLELAVTAGTAQSRLYDSTCVEYAGSERLNAGSHEGKTFHIAGAASFAGGEITATFTPDDSRVGIAQDKVRFTWVRCDIDVDSNNDGTIDSTDDLIEAKPGEWGVRVVNNNDDTDKNGKPDNGEDAANYTGDDGAHPRNADDLAQMVEGRLRQMGSGLEQILDGWDPVVTLEKVTVPGIDNGDVRVFLKKYSAPTSHVEMLNTASTVSTTDTGDDRTLWEGLTAQLPGTGLDVYVEGLRPGLVMLSLKLTIPAYPVPLLTHRDTVKVLVVGMDAVNAGFTAPVTSLKIAKWNDAFDAGPPVSVKADFIDKDGDRFHLRVIDRSKDSESKVSVFVSTDCADNDYDDDATEMELDKHASEQRHDTTTSSGTPARTKAQMLMADDTDDDHQVSGVADDAKNDQTHKAELGSILVLEYNVNGSKTLRKTFNVPEPKTANSTSHTKICTITPVILRNRPQNQGGTALWTTDDAIQFLRIARERYAQIGVRLEWSTPQVVDPPIGVDLSDGLTVAVSGADERRVSQETKTLIDDRGTSTTTDDLHVFFVGTINAWGSNPLGVAIADYWFDEADEDYIYNCVVSSSAVSAPRYFTLPHELGHLLTDQSTHDADSYRLMYAPTTTGNNTVTATKRLSTSQETTIRGNAHVTDPN